MWLGTQSFPILILKKDTLADIHAHNLTIELRFLLHNSKILSNYTNLSPGDLDTKRNGEEENYSWHILQNTFFSLSASYGLFIFLECLPGVQHSGREDLNCSKSLWQTVWQHDLPQWTVIFMLCNLIATAGTVTTGFLSGMTACTGDVWSSPQVIKKK